MALVPSTSEELRNLYYSPTTGYLSASKLYQRVKNSDNPLPYSVIKNFVKSQLSDQLVKQTHKAKIYNSINAEGPGSNYQLDIMVYDRYTFHNYKYILVVIDVYSRFASCVPMTNRQMGTIIKATKECFEEIGKTPQNLNCDGEFNKKEFNDFLKGEGVRVYYSEPYEINKNAIVERFNRTLALLLQRWRVGSKSYDWPKFLPELVDNYNTTYHLTIKATPKEVWEGEKVSMQKKIFIQPMFQPGDQVRIKENKKVFAKGDVLTYSKDIHLVKEVKGNKVYLEGEGKGYKPYELVPIGHVEFNPTANQALAIKEKEEHDLGKLAKEVTKLKKDHGIDQGNIQREKRQPKLKPELVEYLKSK